MKNLLTLIVALFLVQGTMAANFNNLLGGNTTEVLEKKPKKKKEAKEKKEKKEKESKSEESEEEEAE